jgi:hypothetical protein
MKGLTGAEALTDGMLSLFGLNRFICFISVTFLGLAASLGLTSGAFL